MRLMYRSASGGAGPLTYTWGFGDGPATATGPSVTHIYPLAGSYNASVTVSDGTTFSASRAPLRHQ